LTLKLDGAYGPLNGKQVVEESLREKAIYQLNTTKLFNGGWDWFIYMAEFGTRCLTSLTLECSKSIIDEKLHFKYKDVEEYIKTNTGIDNKTKKKSWYMLDDDINSIARNAPSHFPSLYINDNLYRVHFSTFPFNFLKYVSIPNNNRDHLKQNTSCTLFVNL
jgi:hypothetical protein